MKEAFDIGVVGLGAVGSAALYHAVRSGLRAVGFDRFAPPHVHGSSHGGSRIIRRGYFEGSMYVPLLTHAYHLWRDLESVSGRKLMHLDGCLTIGDAESAMLRGAQATAEAHAIAFEQLSPPEVHERFPAFHLRERDVALWEPEAGRLDPEACIETHLDLAVQSGADVRANEPVRTWGVTGQNVRVETDGGTFDLGRLVLCAGGWMGQLLRDIHVPLRVERQVNAWFRPSTSDDRFRPEHCPVYVWEYDRDRIQYGFPDSGDGVKTGLHHTGTVADDPEELDRAVHDEDVELLQRQTMRLLPGACGSVARAATCFYTNTPDEHYLIDRHPGLDRVVYASACSGHGFKASAAVGESLIRLAAGDEPAVDLSPFRLTRFRRE